MIANQYAKWALPLCAATLFLAGCGGGGVNPGTHDMLQTDYDAALAQLMETEGERDDALAELMETEGERDAAQAELDRLTALIGADTDAADTEGSLYAQINAAQADATRLQGELDTATGRVAALETLVGDATTPAADSLRGRLSAAQAQVTSLTVQLNTANNTLATLRTDLATATQAAATARQEAQQQVQQAQQQAAAQIAAAERTREASQRAQNVQAAFPTGTDAAPGVAVGNWPGTITVPSAGRLLIVSDDARWRQATLGGSGLRSATMPLVQGSDPGRKIVYTDRELSRSVLSHFGALRSTNNLARLDLTNADVMVPADGIPHFASTPPVGAMWRINHGVPASVAAVDGDLTDTITTLDDLPDGAEDPRVANSYTAYLYGQSGQFVCTGNDACRVQITPDYLATPTNGRFALQDVAVAAVVQANDGTYSTPAGVTLQFQPRSGATYQLYNGGPVGHNAGYDYEYMVFGYWKEEPLSAGSAYDVHVFAEAVVEPGGNSQMPPGTIDATYDGIAVGMYVEQNQTDAVDTHRQGEFVADIRLTVDGAPDTIEGLIDDFVTTPTGGSGPPRSGGRWIVRLNADNTADILNLSGETVGGWAHAYVQAHEHAGEGSADPAPPGVTGVFNALHGDIERIYDRTDRIGQDSLHIVGAFGAHR